MRVPRWVFVGGFLPMISCTQDFAVFSPDAAPADATAADASDGAAAEDASDSGAGSDAADSGPGTDASDAGGITYACPVGGSVTSCAQCAGNPEPCVFCSKANPSVLTGTCTQMNHGCAPPGGYAVCTCSSAPACPEPYQVCNGTACRTCSENNNDNGLTCQNGGTCNATDGGCN